MEQRRSHGDRGAWTRFQPRLSLLLLIYGTLASCKCGGTSRIIIKDEDVNCDDISLICTCTKGGGKCGKRWLRAAKRTAVAKEVSTQSVHVYRANKAQEMMQEDECEPPNFYSSPVLRVAKHEFLSKQFLDHDPVKAVQLQKRTTGANIIHNIGLDPFYVHYWTNYQVDIYRRYASKNKTSLCFDATGSIVKKIFKPEHGHAGPVFLYQGVMNTEEGQFSVSHMLSESHNTNSIQFWLNEWMRSGAPRPDEVVVDSSKALINAIIRAFTSYNTITEYANACWGSNVPQCYVRIDVAHFIKIYVDFLKTPPERIKIFYRAAIGQLIISRSLRDAEKVFEAILLVSLSETEGLLPDGTKCDSENAKIFIKKLITEENTEINETDNESDSNLREFNVRIANEDAVQEEIIEVMSEWKNWGTNIQKRVTLATESQIGDRENAHYFPALAKKLMNDVAHLPLWSCVVRDKFGYGRIPASSAPVEGEFNKIKTHLLKNETLPIRVDRFLDQHINYMSGRTKLLGAKLIDKEDLAIDNHQSGDNSIATTINENGIVSVADSQELLKSDAIKIGNKSGKEIEENARVQDEAADTLPTQVQCPACQNNDKPTGAHQCIICQTSVHALELCSIALPDSEEGYGQQRICLTCHSTQSVPLILATRNEENWRGLNLQNKNKKRKASKYLGDEKHKIKEKLTFEKNKKLPIIKNGSHESLHALTVNGKKVYVTYTCAFDSVYQVMLAAFCDRPDLRKMVEERDTQTDLIAMVFDVLDKGLRASSYQNRAKIMCSLFTLEPGAYDSFIVNCSTGVPALARKLFQNVPSFTELVVCDNGCDPETSIRAVPIIDEVTLRVDKLDISEVLKLPRVCNVPECTGSVSANISASASGTRLRHYRHLDARSQFLSETLLVTQSDDNHNHKPVFSNCSRYAPEVNEEEAAGTVVIQVRAEDRDLPEEGGTITYSFVTAPGEKLKFEINNRTGLIRTTQVLDRDEPAREKEAYLTVLATDNGRPQLDDVCTFKVTIKDVNDNAPVFDKVAYTESVPQDLPPTREVMRVSATDIDDGNNSVVVYSLFPKRSDDGAYFRIDNSTGVIFLQKPIDRNPGYRFSMAAKAQDLGAEPKGSAIDLDIRVVESHKKAPAFLPRPQEPMRLQENFSDFEASIVRLEAVSNIEDSQGLIFELVPGRTEQTNKGNKFRLESTKNVAEIKLAQHLDYESNTEYTLIVRVQNKYQLAAETVINIKVLDVNDNIPVFRELEKGSVLENEPAGVPVMQVRAIDADGTSAHNQVTYELDNFKNLFAIDKYTGIITTLTTFDREKEDTYNVKVIAVDNSPSALFKTGEHNKGQQQFRIEIADKNDNAPHFTQTVYTANSILENANVNEPVTEVKADDADTASPVTYSIVAGNTDDSFYIEGTTGKIRVNKPLDYEQLTEYNLTVKAFDGLYNDTAQVKIFIENVNDNPPIFEDFERNPKIVEEQLVEGCITTVVAYDPDIKDRSADQHIAYFIVKDDQLPLIGIDKTGCMTLKKPLDRDPPNGYPMWTIIVMARDDDGAPTALRELVMVNITLEDINDNAPFLDMQQPVVWDENKPPGNVTKLRARDYDSDKNGPPFTYQIDDSADEEIQAKFYIHEDDLYARVKFDREERKSYEIPIAITDSGTPSMTGTSTLTVIIGDKNDNPMMEGSSSIFVYNYKGEAPDVDIGRVYVNDPDDWDLPDKHFAWMSTHEGFRLDQYTGMITLLSGTSNDTFLLKFIVTEDLPGVRRHTVNAFVNVTVKEIPEEAVAKSGSIRFHGINAEEFVAPAGDSGISKKEILQERLAEMLNTSVENVDVFTVLHSPHHNNMTLLDVRFSAHGSPYYAPEKLNTIAAQNSKEIEREMEADILLINIDECLFEKVHCNNSCRSVLNASNVPYSVYTNTSSFVGVRAVVDPQCICHVAEPIICLNGGTPLAERCECPPGLEGPRCELLGIGFNGDGWAVMPPPGQACDDSHLGLELTPQVDSGLVFYFGPMSYSPKLGIQDFMSLEIQNGYPVLYVDYGTGTVRLDHKQIKLTDGKSHRIDVYWTKTAIEMKVDNCGISACMSLTAPQGRNEFLNVNSPLQIGGALTNLAELSTNLGWDHKPTDKGFVGCIRNMTINGNTYNLGMPAVSRNVDPGCNHGTAKAVSFGIDTNFLVAILVCIAILLILLLAVVVHRRKRDDLYKDMDDIRENIINYEDEGGGEVDTGYDLNVLRRIYDAPPLDSKIAPVGLQTRAPDEVPDMCGFLDGKKESCDKDPDTNPFDDVRHYAYEGEGNSDGSLSSLASCTDDGDLKFNYLSNFGPRFRKLADMYGEEPSDEDSDGVGERESESWC